MWQPPAEQLKTPRLTLEPLSVTHAPEMVGLLAAPDLYTFTGGTPPDLNTLKRRYAIQSRGHSADGQQAWRNWILREQGSGRAAGYVQATLYSEEAENVADIAWVVGRPFQGRGLATEAAEEMVRSLASHGVRTVRAYIHPDHTASIRVAERLGLLRTARMVGGEGLWELPLSCAQDLA